MSFSVRHSPCHDIPDEKRLSVFERGRTVQRAIAAKVGCGRTVVVNFLKDPEGYGTKKSSSRPQKISPALSRRIRRAVHEDTGRSSTQIKPLTDADCSPNNHKTAFARLLPRHTLARLDQTLKGGRKFYSLTRKKCNLSNITGVTRRSHWRCFLRGTAEEAPSRSGALPP